MHTATLQSYLYPFERSTGRAESSEKSFCQEDQFRTSCRFLLFFRPNIAANWPVRAAL